MALDDSSIRPVPDTPSEPGSVVLAQRRRDAISRARAELNDGGVTASEPTIAIHPFGPGRLAVALAGTFDRAAVERLRGTMRDLVQVATDELVIDLSVLDLRDPVLARFLAQLRAHHLITDAPTSSPWLGESRSDGEPWPIRPCSTSTAR